jgi:hypothetical protein
MFMLISTCGLHNNRITRIFLSRYSKLNNSVFIYQPSLLISLSSKNTTTCVNYVPTTLATYASLCVSSLQVNAPAPNSHSDYKVVPSFPVASKMDCCAACTSVFDCVWWKFDPGTLGNGWAPGACHYVYYIGSGGDVAERRQQSAKMV